MTLPFAVLAFLHVLGAAAWIGGAFAAMAVSLAARHEAPQARPGVYRVLGRIHAWVVAPGALVTVLAGFGMVMVLVTRGLGERLGIPTTSIMMGTGLVAALLVLVVGLPAAQRAAGLAAESDIEINLPALERLRARLAVVSSIAGVLALIALYCGVTGP